MELRFYVTDVSFAIPQRKKLRLEVTRLVGSIGGGVFRARNQVNSEIEFGVPIERIIPDGPPRTAFLGSAGTPVTDGAGLDETYRSWLIGAMNEELRKGGKEMSKAVQ
ncbi:hypothetical protein KEM54_004217, partial [Ascosphaera aggregata]